MQRFLRNWRSTLAGLAMILAAAAHIHSLADLSKTDIYGELAGKYEAIDLVDQWRKEPVKLYQQLTTARDGAIDLVRKVQ
jgi:hypothetical protein